MKTVLRNASILIALVAAAAGTAYLHARAAKNNVGQTLPEMKLEFLGEAPQLAGKPLIVEFWATWCEPCRGTIPHLNDLWKTYKDKGLVIVGVTKEDAATVKAFVKELPIDYHVALDPSSSLTAHLGITVIPHAILVDKTGKITWEGHPSTMQPGDIDAVLK